MVESAQDQSPRMKELRSRETYLGPELRECDVVMKGGITSGVLYPLAVCELATRYRLCSVGGTSAGAIAAAAAAAAEVGRSSGQLGSGFDGLAQLPNWLRSDEHLLGLFRPPGNTRRLHGVLVRMVTPGTKLTRKAVAFFGFSLVSSRWWLPVFATIPGLFLVLALLVGDGGSPLAWVGAVVALILAVIGLGLGAVVSALLTAGHVLEKNHYGIVTGSQAHDGADSLSDWLADKLDELAGKRGALLTFGDLQKAGVNLEMMTTNITEGRPYRLPHDLGSQFCFDEDELRLHFPQRVVDHLLAHAPGPRTATGLVPLPPADQLPVVVATRMSLSFPLLISAVPLYSVDSSKLACGEKTFERSWFSDGGIASNFPISFFDSLLPSRPTFGINLRPFHECFPISDDERRNVWMPRRNGDGIIEWWARWPDGKGLGSVGSFLWTIVRTMQNWVDNTQTRVPGYRDRIVHISHTEEEGGMNLAMPPARLARLAERGRCAGERLWAYYTTPPREPLPVEELQTLDHAELKPRTVSWENHRWIRLRTSLALFADSIGSLSDAVDDDYTGDLMADINAAPGYRFANKDQQALAQALVLGVSGPTIPTDPTPRVRLSAGLRQLADEISDVERRGLKVPLGVEAPAPAPTLRIAPGSQRTRDELHVETDDGPEV